MNRFIVEDLFGIEGFSIAWYGAIIACGMLLGIALAIKLAKKRGYKEDLILDLAVIAIPTAIVGARLYYVIFEWRDYVSDPLRIFAIRDGGLAIYGGVLAGLLAAFLYSKKKAIPYFQLVDLLIPSLVLGQAIGRWGNFTNQEAYGNRIMNESLQFFPYGVYIDALGEWHQATFFYESMWNLLLFVFLLVLFGKQKKDGILLATYLIGYGLGRFLIEGLRSDSLYLIGELRVSQLLSLILMLIGAAIVLKHSKLFEK